MIKTKLSPYLFEEEDLEKNLEEYNAIGTGMVSGYQAPLGAKGIGSDKSLEKGFWREKFGKKVKTSSPKLHKKIKTILERPYGEYPEVGLFLDFKIEMIPDLSKETKTLITRKFEIGEINFLCKISSKYFLCTQQGMHQASEQEIKKAIDPADVNLETNDSQILKLNHEILIAESFGAMNQPDFDGEAMAGLWKGLEDPKKPIKTSSPKLHKKSKPVMV